MDICMHDLLSLKHCICDHTDMINAITVQCALEDTRGELLCPTAIKQAGLFDDLDLTVRMLAFLILPGKLLSREMVPKCQQATEPRGGLIKTWISEPCSQFLIQ